MKKIITMFMLMAMAIMVNAAVNPVYVYDYAVTYKTVAANKTQFKQNGVKYNLDTAKVASDKLKGYVIVPACEACNGTMEESTSSGNEAIIYVVRSGDKAKRVYRAVGAFKANMFGSRVAQNLITGDLINGDKFTDASAFLTFPLDWEIMGDEGFLGRRNFSCGSYDGDASFTQYTQKAEYLCWNAGFGKVGRSTSTVDYGCFTETNNCYYVSNLSGQIMAMTCFTGTCTEMLFDVCNPAEKTDIVVPVVGTFTMKLNKSITFKSGEYRALSFSEAEELVRQKLAFEEIFVPANDTADEDYDLQEGFYWAD